MQVLKLTQNVIVTVKDKKFQTFHDFRLELKIIVMTCFINY